MSRRTVVFVVALLLAAVAAFSVWRYLATVEENVRSDISEVVVYRATEDIAEGTAGAVARDSIASSTDLAVNVGFDGSTIVCEGPKNRNAPDVDFSLCAGNPADLDAVLANNVSVGLISRGQLITSDMFVPAEQATDRLAAAIPVGKVAIAISPGDVGAVGGLIEPGDRVNVLATFRLDVSTINALLADPDTRDLLFSDIDLAGLVGSTQPEVVIPGEEGGVVVEPAADALSSYANALPDTIDFTQIILQNVNVLAVGGRTAAQPPAGDEEQAGEMVLVLEVTPEETEKLEFARQRTQLAVTLLPADGTYSEVAATGATVDDIFGYLTKLRDTLEGLSGR